jgi:hypothetical protein
VLEFADAEARRRHFDRYLTSDELVAALPRLRRPFNLDVVALAPPPTHRRPARWATRATVRATPRQWSYRAAGRRLFLEFDVDEVIRSNVVRYLFSDQ